MAASYPHLDEMQPWNARLQLLECLAVTPETADVMTFTFRPEKPGWFRYLPGQFVTLELPAGPDGARDPLMRTYTLSSSPSRPFTVAVTVKAQRDSVGTRWMFENLKPGMKIRALGPLGDFSYVRHPAQKYLFISAGSGITPMMSMTRDLGDRAPASDIVFVNCSRTPADIVFRRELEELSRHMPKLTLGLIVENCPRHDAWVGLQGMIDRAKITMFAHDFHERTVFCCGPEPFMTAVRALLDSAGFDMANYHQESFAPALPAQGELPSTAQDGEIHANVAFTLSGKEVPCQPGQTVLMTARANGVRIGAACESGLCGTCRVLLVSGEVDMNHNGGILDDEIEEGYILACCSRPRGDVAVEA